MVISQHSMSLKGGHFECHTSWKKKKKKIEEGKYVEEIKKKPFFKIHNF